MCISLQFSGTGGTLPTSLAGVSGSGASMPALDWTGAAVGIVDTEDVSWACSGDWQ